MKLFTAACLCVALALGLSLTASAQAAESLWLQANPATFKTGETVTVTFNGSSAQPVQGFTAQIRYDPACLQPVSSTSPITGMNGLPVPQTAGLADVSFASPTPQVVNGVLAEVRFTALKGCQTDLTLQTAALVIRNEAGLAAALPGISLNQNPVAVSIDSAVGYAQSVTASPAGLPLTPTVFPEPAAVPWWQFALPILGAGLLLAFMIAVYKQTRPFEW